MIEGPSSLDWAITTGQKIWGVTILQAAAEMDAGPIWASHNFSLPASPLAKSSLYRQQVTEAAVRGVLEAVEKFQSGSFQPEPLDYARPDVLGSLQPNMRQSDRAIDWTRDDTAAIVRKVRAADSAPGVLSALLGMSCFLYGAHEEDRIKGPPGQVSGASATARSASARSTARSGFPISRPRAILTRTRRLATSRRRASAASFAKKSSARSQTSSCLQHKS